MVYTKLLRPILFKYSDPETIHNYALRLLAKVSTTRFLNTICTRLLATHDNRLRTSLGKLRLSSPVGLSAGFDKYIDAPLAYPMLGFGFAELGSITYSPQEGNPKPRLWRLPHDKGLIVHYGLANAGVTKTLERYTKIPLHTIPYGISIAPSNGLSGPAMAEDYVKTFEAVQASADYITLNVSCPNVAGESIFSQLSFIKLLLSRIALEQKKIGMSKDIFIKIGPRISDSDLSKIVDYALEAKITGIIATNLIKDRSDIDFKSAPDLLNHPGGISGKHLQTMSTRTIRTLYQLSKGRLCIIGVGGIFTPEDAYHKIKAGATAVQLITGFIYGGPTTIHTINKGLLRLLAKDGYKNISEAIGVEA